MTAAFVELRMKMVDLVTRRGWEPDSTLGPHRWKKQEKYCRMDAELCDAYCIERMNFEAEECDAN